MSQHEPRTTVQPDPDGDTTQLPTRVQDDHVPARDQQLLSTLECAPNPFARAPRRRRQPARPRTEPESPPRA